MKLSTYSTYPKESHYTHTHAHMHACTCRHTPGNNSARHSSITIPHILQWNVCLRFLKNWCKSFCDCYHFTSQFFYKYKSPFHECHALGYCKSHMLTVHTLNTPTTHLHMQPCTHMHTYIQTLTPTHTHTHLYHFSTKNIPVFHF